MSEYVSKQIPPFQRWAYGAVVYAADLNNIIEMLVEQGNNSDAALAELFQRVGALENNEH